MYYGSNTGDAITLNCVFNIHVNFVLQYAIVEGRDFLLIYCLQYIKHIKCKYQVTAMFPPTLLYLSTLYIIPSQLSFLFAKWHHRSYYTKSSILACQIFSDQGK